MKELEVKSLYTLTETLAAPLLSEVTYPWEALPKIGAFILELGATLSEEEYEKRGENIWIARSAKVAPTAFIAGCGSVLNPGTVIGRNSNIYPLSSVRGVVASDSIYKKQGEVAQKR